MQQCQFGRVPSVYLGMGRPLRYLPPSERDGEGDGWHLVEITSRTVQSRHLLRPGSKLNRLVLGCLGRAQRQTGVRIHDFVFLSNHFHLLASVESVEQQARFLRCLGWITVEVRHVHGWEGKLWRRRARSIPVSDEEEAQVARLRYLYSQGVKENLVTSPEDWPGAASVGARMQGHRTLQGDWVDRTRLHRERRRGARERDCTDPETIALSPLPAWADLSWSEYRDRVRELVGAIREEARLRHRTAGTRPVGAEAVLSVDPFGRPERSKRSPAPRFHAASRDVRRQLEAAYRCFVELYREASRRFRDGEGGVRFPEGCFPPPPAYCPVARPP
mgnify:CR=1 FL=1